MMQNDSVYLPDHTHTYTQSQSVGDWSASLMFVAEAEQRRVRAVQSERRRGSD